MIQEKFLVTGILTNGSTANIKMIADKAPMQEAKPAEPDVEDAYMYLMNHTSASKSREQGVEVCLGHYLSKSASKF